MSAGVRAGISQPPTMVQIVTVLSETYTDEGVATLLSAAFHRTGETIAEVCRTAEGRYEVWAWAESLTGMIAT